MKNYSSYDSTVVLDSVRPKVKPCIDFKTSPFFVKLETDFFSRATNINMDSYLVELSQSLLGYSIAELDSPLEFLFVTSKMIAHSWFMAAGSFASSSDIIPCGVYLLASS